MRTAAIYARISRDDRGTHLGVDRQIADVETLITARGWQPGLRYVDNDVSATSGKRRPAYERLLEDMRAGRVEALAVWDVDRLSRTPAEIEEVITVAMVNGVVLASVAGDTDVLTEQGRLTTRIKGAVARYEVEQMKRRIRRKFDELAAAGQPHGAVPYGWRREIITDDAGRRTGARDVLRPDQADVVLEMARRIVRGESIRSVTADLNRRSLPAPRGGTWTPPMVKQVLLRERNVGLRRHRGEVIGPGTWEPLMPADLYDRVVAVLTDPSRKVGTRSRKHLLSGIAECGKCDGGLIRVIPGTHGPVYVCTDCHGIRRKQEPVDAYVSKVMIARLSRPDAAAAFHGDDQTARAKAEQAAGLRARLDLAADSYADGQIDAAQLARITSRLRPQLEAAEAKVRRLASRPDLLDLAGPDIAQRWDGLPLERKQAAILALATVRIMPAAKRGWSMTDPAAEVEIRWR